MRSNGYDGRNDEGNGKIAYADDSYGCRRVRRENRLDIHGVRLLSFAFLAVRFIYRIMDCDVADTLRVLFCGEEKIPEGKYAA